MFHRHKQGCVVAREAGGAERAWTGPLAAWRCWVNFVGASCNCQAVTTAATTLGDNGKSVAG